MSGPHFLPLWIFDFHPMSLLPAELPSSPNQSVFPAQAAETLHHTFHFGEDQMSLSVQWETVPCLGAFPGEWRYWAAPWRSRLLFKDHGLRTHSLFLISLPSFFFFFSCPSYSSGFSSNLPSMLQHSLCSSGCAVRGVCLQLFFPVHRFIQAALSRYYFWDGMYGQQ